MKALKTKVILSAAVLLFALVATIGSTFAWFTVTNTNDVTTPTLQIQAVDSLLIKLANSSDTQADSTTNADPTDYSQGISASDILGHASYSSMETWTLFPVSAVQTAYDSINAGSLHSLGAGYLRPLTPGVTRNTASTGEVITIKFWLMAQSDNNYVKVNNVVITGQSGTNADDLIEGSVRLAVTIDSTGLGGPQTGFIFGNAGEVDFDFTFVGTANEYTGATTPGEGFDTLDEHTTGLSTTLEESTQLGVAGTSQICELDTLSPVLVTVDIFIEGWDADTTGDIIAGLLNVTFDFTIA